MGYRTSDIFYLNFLLCNIGNRSMYLKHILLNNLFLALCVLVFCLDVCLCEGVESLGTGVTKSCELLCGYWKLNSGPLEEQPMLLTAKPPLQPSDLCT